MFDSWSSEFVAEAGGYSVSAFADCPTTRIDVKIYVAGHLRASESDRAPYPCVGRISAATSYAP